jgi:hypothetical protein
VAGCLARISWCSTSICTWGQDRRPATPKKWKASHLQQ